jgi:hypothetical protein
MPLFFTFQNLFFFLQISHTQLNLILEKKPENVIDLIISVKQQRNLPNNMVNTEAA